MATTPSAGRPGRQYLPAIWRRILFVVMLSCPSFFIHAEASFHQGDCVNLCYQIEQLHVDYLPTAPLTLSQIRALPASPLTLPWSAGFTSQPAFFLLTLHTERDHLQQIIEVSPTFLEKVTLRPLLARPGAKHEQYIEQTQGLDVAAGGHHQVFRHAAFDVRLAGAGEHHFLLTLDSRSVKALQLSFYTQEAYYQKDITSAIGFMLLYGSLGMMVLITLLTGLVLRESVYLVYSLYVLASSCIHFIAQGWAKYLGFWFESVPQLDVMALMMMLTLVSGIELIRITNLHIHYPRLWRWLRAGGLMMVAGLLCLLWAGHYSLVSASLQVVFLLLILFMTLMTAVLSFKGERAAQIYLLAFVAHNVSSVIRILASFGVVSLGAFSLFAINVTIVIHALLIYLAVLARVKHLKADSARLEKMDIKLKFEMRLRELQARFFKLLTHDFRMPVSVIGHALEQDDAGKPESMRVIRHQFFRLEQLIDQYVDMHFKLDVARDDGAPTDIADVLGAVVAHYQFASDRHEISLTPVSALPCRLNAGIMEMIVGNLISNVIRHAPEGTHCEVSGWQEKDQLLIQVCDDGPGIQRLNKGVGLTLTWEAVESLDGQIEFFIPLTAAIPLCCGFVRLSSQTTCLNRNSQ
ncbi:hypothetical protein B6S08_02485 [Oceanimonas doudoroffii]|uniref:histidine kinase n=1 Tax=Oceanimonas doudoroffii TaxID=84158 RepID=A0A233RGA0_9GAMM|nr:hypothetical protein B6S08_02485 [Oceanimonas doudoroffii]